MRLGLSAFFLVLASCLTAPVFSQQETSPLEQVTTQLATENTKLSKASQAVINKQNELSNHQDWLTRLQKKQTSLQSAFNKTKKQLESEYNKLINAPDYDISHAQKAYQKAWSELKKNQQQILEAQQTETELGVELSQLKQVEQQHQQLVDGLQAKRQRERVAVLRKELTQPGEEKVSFTNTCTKNMTLSACTEQTTTLALQKAVRQFQTNLISGTTDADVVRQHENAAAFNIHVLKHEASAQRFSGQNQFRTVQNVKLVAKPAENAPCKFLNIDSQYCFAPGENDAGNSMQEEIPWHNLSIRSNKYHDKVVIDGVSYGPSPVEVMLPAGMHSVSVIKEGYRPYTQQLRITTDQMIRAELTEIANKAVSGEQFADTLDRTHKAPQMSVISAGSYRVGHNGTQTAELTQGFAISSAPITVAEFRLFVEQTNYITDAEKRQMCSAVSNGDIITMGGKSWREPGFNQQDNFPVVCISLKDAQAYARWLTQKTGFIYRLPSETEWEIAARGGSISAYWWGNVFEAGQANTGWGGTRWSNQSPSPVTAFSANRFGILDAVGNVWEWTSLSKGLLKGGAWSFSPEKAKADSELFIAPDVSANFAGFRVVRAL